MIADPVSCAIISRRKGEADFALSIGKLASMKNGVPYSCSRSTAIERPAVKGTPCALSQVDRLIADCKKRIARQREVIASAFQEGGDTPRSLYRCCEPLRRAFEPREA